jgi:hypothetical protein
MIWSIYSDHVLGFMPEFARQIHKYITHSFVGRLSA